VRGYLAKLFPKVLQQLPGCEIINYNIQSDHVHVVMIIPPRYVVGVVVAKMKGTTGAELGKKFDWLSQWYWLENVV